MDFETEQRRLAEMRERDLGETRLTLTPFFAAFRFAWSNRWGLLRIGWPLLLAVLAASLAFEPLLGETLGGLLTLAVYFGAAAILAVAVHRWIVFDAPPPPHMNFYFRFRAVEWKFALLLVGWWVAFGVAVVLVIIPSGFLGGIVNAAASLFSGSVTGMQLGGYLAFAAVMLAVSWLAIRTCLVFPHLAVTERFDWRLSWRAMAGKFWTAFLIFLMAGTIFILLGSAVNLPFEALGVVSEDEFGGPHRLPPPPGFLSVLYKSLSTILWGITEVVWIALLSHIYREVIQAEQIKPEPPDTGTASDEPVVLDSKDWTG